MMFKPAQILLGRGVCTGAARVETDVEYYLVDGDTIRSYAYNVTYNAADGQGVIIGYGQAYARRGSHSFSLDRGEIRHAD